MYAFADKPSLVIVFKIGEFSVVPLLLILAISHLTEAVIPRLPQLSVGGIGTDDLSSCIILDKFGEITASRTVQWRVGFLQGTGGIILVPGFGPNPIGCIGAVSSNVGCLPYHLPEF